MSTAASNVPEYVSDAPSARAMRMLRLWIADGRLPAGERLPSEQILSERLDVARSTIRVVLQQLEQEGLVTFRGRTRIVSDSVRPQRTILSQTIAMLVDNDLSSLLPTENNPGREPFIQAAAIAAIRTAGLHAMTLQSELLQGGEVHRMIAERPRGIIAFRKALQSEQGQSIIKAFQHAGIPIVGYGHAPELLNADTVASDHDAGSYELTRWLIARGCKRILRYWHGNWEPTNRPEWVGHRDRGFERAMRQANLEILPPLELYGMQFKGTPHEGFQFNVRLATGALVPYLQTSPGIDAIIAISDGIIPALASACKTLGKQPNRDVLFAGYDNYYLNLPERQWDATIPLATVDKDNSKLGRELVDLLMARIAGTLPNEPQHRLVTPTLIVTGVESAEKATS